MHQLLAPGRSAEELSACGLCPEPVAPAGIDPFGVVLTWRGRRPRALGPARPRPDVPPRPACQLALPGHWPCATWPVDEGGGAPF